MTVLAWILGVIGGLCAAMGIVTAIDVIPALTGALPGFDALLWVALGVFFMLTCIAAVLSRNEME